MAPSPSAEDPMGGPWRSGASVGHQRVRVVGALPGVVEREVLLEGAGAEHEGDGAMAIPLWWSERPITRSR